MTQRLAPLSPPSAGSFAIPTAVGLVAVLALYASLTLPFASHTVDDAWITFRYSRQWSLGHGPYFNPGEHVEGYGNLLLVLLLAPVIRLGGAEAALPAAKAIGFASGALALLGAFACARRLAREGGAEPPWADVAGVAAAALVACVPGFGYHAVSGLGTALYGCLVTWGVYGMSAGTPRASVLGGLALAAAAISQPEGPMIFLLAWLLAARGRVWRAHLAAGALGAVFIGAQLLFRHAAYDGESLPNTYFARLGGSGDRLAYIREAILPEFFGVAGLALAALGWGWSRRLGRAGLVVAGVALAGCLLPLRTGADWMPGYRMIAPYLPLAGAAVAAGWLRLVARLARGSQAAAATAVLIAAPASWALQSTAREDLLQDAIVEAGAARTGHAALAEWIARAARPGDAIALMDSGLIGYRCIDQRIVDVSGLTDRHIAKSPGTLMAKQFDPGYVFDIRPAFIVLTFFGREDRTAPAGAPTPLLVFSDREGQLVAHGEFARHYARAVESAAPAGNDLDALAALLRAERVFPYAFPGRRYFLAIYRRHD